MQPVPELLRPKVLRVVTDINEGDAKQVADDINGLAIRCDISLEKDVTNLVRSNLK